MNHDTTSTALTGNTWTKIAEYASSPPKIVGIKNLSTSANVAKILVKPNNINADPTDEEGFTVEVGELRPITKLVSGGGDGLITEVWGKSAGATVEVNEDG